MRVFAPRRILANSATCQKRRPHTRHTRTRPASTARTCPAKIVGGERRSPSIARLNASLAMPSPFPGMDPFLEHPAIFPGLHERLIAYLSESLQARLPEPYYAEIGERLWVETSDRSIGPDVHVVGRRRDATATGGLPADVGLATEVRSQPVVVTVPQDEFREPYVEICASGESRARGHGDRSAEPDQQDAARRRGASCTCANNGRSWRARSTSWKSTCCAAASTRPPCRCAAPGQGGSVRLSRLHPSV